MAEVLMTWSLPAETKEFVGPITVTADGLSVTTFEVAFTLSTGRPTTWSTPDVVGGDQGIIVGGTLRPLVVGKKYLVWVRFTDNPEIPVTRACFVKVT
jgi:hypothetical protein